MKQKVVKVKLVETVAEVLAYSEEHGVVQVTCHLNATFKTSEGLEKAVRKYLEGDNLGLVKVISSTKINGIYSMPIEKFLVNASEEEKIPIE